jgi:hypothetical protein
MLKRTIASRATLIGRRPPETPSAEVMALNTEEFEQLRAHASQYAQQYDVEAHLSMDDMLGSELNPAGPRVHLQVVRRIEGQPSRDCTKDIGGYRENVADLKERLEGEIRNAVRRLHAAP